MPRAPSSSSSGERCIRWPWKWNRHASLIRARRSSSGQIMARSERESNIYRRAGFWCGPRPLALNIYRIVIERCKEFLRRRKQGGRTASSAYWIFRTNNECRNKQRKYWISRARKAASRQTLCVAHKSFVTLIEQFPSPERAPDPIQHLLSAHFYLSPLGASFSKTSYWNLSILWMPPPVMMYSHRRTSDGI